MTDHHVLVPVDLDDEADVPRVLFEVLSPVSVTILGYHDLRGQTSTARACRESGDQAEDRLTDIRERAESLGCPAGARLVFTHDRERSIRRVTAETDSDALLIPGAVTRVDDVLVSMRGSADPEHLAGLVGAFGSDATFDVTLLSMAPDGNNQAEAEPGDTTFDRAVAVLREAGVEESRITSRVVATDAPTDAVDEIATAHDLVVFDEDAPSLGPNAVGEVIRESECGRARVLVVRRPESG